MYVYSREMKEKTTIEARIYYTMWEKDIRYCVDRCSHKTSEETKRKWVVMIQPNKMTLRNSGVRVQHHPNKPSTLEKRQACGYGGYHEREMKRQQGNS